MLNRDPRSHQGQGYPYGYHAYSPAYVTLPPASKNLNPYIQRDSEPLRLPHVNQILPEHAQNPYAHHQDHYYYHAAYQTQDEYEPMTLPPAPVEPQSWETGVSWEEPRKKTHKRLSRPSSSLVQNQDDPKKRDQVKVACGHCRTASKKCSQFRPCQRCILYNLEDSCFDPPKKKRESKSRGPYKARRKSVSQVHLPAPEIENTVNVNQIDIENEGDSETEFHANDVPCFDSAVAALVSAAHDFKDDSEDEQDDQHDQALDSLDGCECHAPMAHEPHDD